MKPIRTFKVTPTLPASLERLRSLAYNLRWTWNQATVELFRRLDTDLWESTGHNPVLMLGEIDQPTLEAAALDEGVLAHLNGISGYLTTYLSSQSPWFRLTHGSTSGPLVAYFSAEFGLTECLSIFAGGLGMLAGDHLKSSSDLGVPLVGVGLLYQQGYFRQYLNEAGWQQEKYEDNDFHNLPLMLERRPDGSPLTVDVPYPGRVITAQVWRAEVGRISLFLLDANIPVNRREDQDITDQLYGGDNEMRIKQEILLGIGGFRALQALGFSPTIYHMNEGHAAFAALERIRTLMESHRLTFAAAREAASASLVFTTHTAVAAGHDYFAPELMDRYFDGYPATLGLSRDEFLALGRLDQSGPNDPFCMTILALRLAAYSNGVSKLHGQVTRQMWQALWPGVPEDEIPVDHITNGVHYRSWVSREMDQIYDRYLGARWREEPADEDFWRRVERVPAVELWRAHERRRELLVTFARQCLRGALERRGAPQAELRAADEVLDPKALTIGFARRFATYKRGTLILRDVERLCQILNHPERPVQFIFAGKAHPRDDAGKELIRQIVALTGREGFRHRVVFIEDYDMAIARYLVQGCDVWLNNPRRTLEACGTSGMKAAANGVLNVSTLDGWWDEAWNRSDENPKLIGWAIGRGETYESAEQQDQIEAEALYNLLEKDVVPTFYDRGPDGIPRAWIDRMKECIVSLSPVYSTHRMVREYTERYYLPAARRFDSLCKEDFARAQALADWQVRMRENWPQVRISLVDEPSLAELEVGCDIRVRALVRLGALKPDDLRVELCIGRLNAHGSIVEPEIITMDSIEPDGADSYLFEAHVIACRKSGLQGYTVRVLPNQPDLVTPFLPGFIAWA